MVYVSLGDGTTAEGEVEEAVRQAVRTPRPVIFLIEDDKYAISVPVTWAVPGATLQLYRHYEEFGALVFAATAPTRWRPTAVWPGRRLRARAQGPGHPPRPGDPADVALLRPTPRTSTAPPEDLADEAARDPLLRLAGILRDAGILDDERQTAARYRRGRLVRHSVDAVVEAPRPDPAPTSCRTSTRVTAYRRAPEQPPVANGEPVEMRYALNRALKAAMEANPRLVMFGEDVADAAFPGLPGKGGVFHVTRGLQFAFPDRVWNSALAEATIVGTAMGYVAGAACCRWSRCSSATTSTRPAATGG